MSEQLERPNNWEIAKQVAGECQGLSDDEFRAALKVAKDAAWQAWRDAHGDAQELAVEQ